MDGLEAEGYVREVYYSKPYQAMEHRFDARLKPGHYMPNPNLSPGERAPIITSDRPEVIQFFLFGMTPFWAKKRISSMPERRRSQPSQ